MPKLVVYVPARIWRRLEQLEGSATKAVARAIANRALVDYTKSTPDDPAPKRSSGTSGVAALTAGRDSGVDTS